MFFLMSIYVSGMVVVALLRSCKNARSFKTPLLPIYLMGELEVASIQTGAKDRSSKT